MDHAAEGCESGLPVDVIFRINPGQPAKKPGPVHRFAPVGWSAAGV
jgi:hypothetical protein